MNNVQLLGRLTKTPELRKTTNGTSVVDFTLAINRKFTNQNGEREADFIKCQVWNKQAENLAKYCSKGSQIAIEGRIQTRTYEDENGNKKYITEVIAESITFLSIKQEENINNKSIETIDTDEIELSDDDLPF